MFGKDKVKAHNRIIRVKSGFKVTRISDFLRKKDDKDNTVRNIVLGVGAISTLGIGTALLLKKKGSIKFPGQVNKTNSLAKVQEKVVVVPKPSSVVKNSDMTPGEKFIKEMDEEWGVSKSQIPDPWDTPIKTKINTSSDMLIKPKSGGTKILPPAKASARPNLKRKEKLIVSDRDKVTSSVVNMRNTQKNYDSLPLDMKVTVQMEKLLRKPIQEGIGRPPDTSGLKTILDIPKNSDIDTVVKKATRKVTTRLKGQAEKKAKTLKKN